MVWLWQIPHGGWFPLILAAGFFFLACLWYWGTGKLVAHVTHMAHMAQQSSTSPSPAPQSTAAVAEDRQPLVHRRATIMHGEGLAVFSVDPICKAPLAFLQLMQSMPVLHDALVFLTTHKVNSGCEGLGIWMPITQHCWNVGDSALKRR